MSHKHNSAFPAALIRTLSLAALFACVITVQAHADVGVILNETLNESAGRITGSGHTAVYFSRICPESPVRLRLCGPGENGSVMSNYTNLGEDTRFEWNIVPLNMYVYGATDPANRPVFGTEKIKSLLEARYREETLSSYCTVATCLKSDKAEWREMVGAGMVRSMYIFVVETSLQQDLDLIAKFNALPNQNHFNGMTHNCADFTKDVIDTYFPHAAHRDVINDFGMTSPKAVARTFSRYAQSHPESYFRVMHFSQLPGTIKRSTEPHSGTEQLYHSKKLLVPMVIFADHELPIAAAAYLITGRFNPEREFEQHATLEPAQLSDSSASTSIATNVAKNEFAVDTSTQLEPVQIQQREEILGAPGEWQKYRKQFDTIVAQAVQDEIIPNRGAVSRVFKRMDSAGRPFAAADGSLWLEISDASGTAKVGLSASNIFAHDSDPRLAFELLLARVDAELKSPKHSRETMMEFKEDWALVEYARTRLATKPVVESLPTPDSCSTRTSAAGAK